MSKLGAVAQTVSKIGKVGKIIPGGSLMEAGAMAFDTFENASTKDEKAEGYGAAAGNLAGTMADHRYCYRRLDWCVSRQSGRRGVGRFPG
jgi:hypothetical protein